VRIHIYSLYNWLPALLREPSQVFSDGPAFLAIDFYILLCLCHIYLCLAVVRMGFWFYSRLPRPTT
jgi:hypothetical protein